MARMLYIICAYIVENMPINSANKNANNGMNRMNAPAEEEPTMGGRRKTRSNKRKGGKSRKMGKGASSWNKKVMEIYRELKKKNPSVKLGAAMKEASKRKKAGKL